MVLEIMRKSLELCYSLLIPVVEGENVSPVSSDFWSRCGIASKNEVY